MENAASEVVGGSASGRCTGAAMMDGFLRERLCAPSVERLDVDQPAPTLQHRLTGKLR